jgi:hypothetical protein
MSSSVLPLAKEVVGADLLAGGPGRQPRERDGRAHPLQGGCHPVHRERNRLLEDDVAVEDDVDLAALLQRDPLPIREHRQPAVVVATAPVPDADDADHGLRASGDQRVRLLAALRDEHRHARVREMRASERVDVQRDRPARGDLVLARPSVLDARLVGPVDVPRRLAGDDAVDGDHERRDELLRAAEPELLEVVLALDGVVAAVARDGAGDPGPGEHPGVVGKQRAHRDHPRARSSASSRSKSWL